MIRRKNDDGAEVEIYQKIETGDVLSFLPPDGNGAVDVVVSRVIDGLTGKPVAAVSPGRVGQSVFLPKSFFDPADCDRLPVSTVARAKSKE